MDFVDVGSHPAVVVSLNALTVRPGHVAVIPVTGTSGPAATHIPLTPEAGLTRYDESYADLTALQPVDRLSLLRQRGRLSPRELATLGQALSVYLGLCDEHDAATGEVAAPPGTLMRS